MAQLELFNYFRSSAAYRVRIALNIKGLPYKYTAVHLLNQGGEQNHASYKQVNPMGEVPSINDNGFNLGQSMAIMWYLEDLKSEPPLFPTDSRGRVRVIELCEAVNSGIHPLQNLKVLQELEKRFAVDAATKENWCRFWIERGFTGLEKLMSRTAREYSFGSQLSAADCYLVPQMFNARRFNCDLSQFPTLCRVDENCRKLTPFQKADPMVQPDAPK